MDRRNGVTGGPTSSLFTNSTPALAPSLSSSSSRNFLPLSSRIPAESQPEPSVEEPEPEPGEFELGLGSGRIWHDTSLLAPVPLLPFPDDIVNFSLEEAEVETLRASSPLPQLEDLPSSESAPSEPDSPQPTIQEILQILRPQFRPLSNANDFSPSTFDEEAGVKETEGMSSGAQGQETEANQDHDEDENLPLIHAMLHGESANTVSGPDSPEVESYPVYIEELELLDGGEGVWLGADLED